MGIGPSSARPPLAILSPTGAAIVLQTQGVCVSVTGKRQVSPQLPVRGINSSGCSNYSGERTIMLQQAYDMPSVTDVRQQQQIGLTNNQTNVNPPRCQAIETQEARPSEQNVLVPGQFLST